MSQSSRDVIVAGYFPGDPKTHTTTDRTRRDAPATRYEQGLGSKDPSKQPVTITGVKGARPTPFRKKFRNIKEYERGADTEAAGDYEVHEVFNS